MPNDVKCGLRMIRMPAGVLASSRDFVSSQLQQQFVCNLNSWVHHHWLTTERGAGQGQILCSSGEWKMRSIPDGRARVAAISWHLRIPPFLVRDKVLPMPLVLG